MPHVVPRSVAIALVLSATSLAATRVAEADDAGVHAFWRSEAARVRPAGLETAYDRTAGERPLSVRVRPRSIRHQVAHHRSAPTRNALAEQMQAYADLNPKSHPDWYLNDPTLRRGDIVVLPDKVLVYRGEESKSRTLADFADIRTVKSLSRETRDTLQRAASL